MKAQQQMATHLLGLALLASGSAVASEGSQCINLTDSASRLACYDAALKPHPNVTGAPDGHTAKSSGAPAKATSEAVAAARADFGLPPPSERPGVAQERLNATVVALQKVPIGQVFTLDNGQVWQISSYLPEPFVRVHDSVVINRGKLGAFLMVRTSGGDSVYVKRLQ